jgi:hypothetical protein
MGGRSGHGECRPHASASPSGGPDGEAAAAGASKHEAAEAIGVGIMMQGGPATVYGARAYAAFCEFADATNVVPA